MNLLAQLTSLFAPDDCLSCGREGALLCGKCGLLLPPLPARCYRCYAEITTGVCCLDCLAINGFAAMRAATGYAGSAQELVVRLKFQAAQSAVIAMAQAMLQTGSLPGSPAILVPIPATTQHVRQRGYDQGILLAKALSRHTGLPVLKVLARHGQVHQLGADRQTRLLQLAASLRVTAPKRIQGRHIILVDDVLTTGASLQAAATVLRTAGAQQVSAWVFAQA